MIIGCNKNGPPCPCHNSFELLNLIIDILTSFSMSAFLFILLWFVFLLLTAEFKDRAPSFHQFLFFAEFLKYTGQVLFMHLCVSQKACSLPS